MYNRRMERNYTANVDVCGMCDVDAQSLPDRHQSEWRSYQVSSPMMIEFQNFILVLMLLKETQVIKLQ